MVNTWLLEAVTDVARYRERVALTRENIRLLTHLFCILA